MELFDVMRTTFAGRAYTGDPLPDATLYRILEHARFADAGDAERAKSTLGGGIQIPGASFGDEAERIDHPYSASACAAGIAKREFAITGNGFLHDG